MNVEKLKIAFVLLNNTFTSDFFSGIIDFKIFKGLLGTINSIDFSDFTSYLEYFTNL